MRLSERQMKWVLNLFPPWLLQRIRVVSIAPGFRAASVRVRRSLLTRNLNGTRFGGTIFAAIDPVYAVLYWQIFAAEGLAVQAWLRSASIRYVKPAAAELRIEFRITDEEVRSALETLRREGRFARTHRVEAIDRAGVVCAVAETDVYLRLPREGQKEMSAF